MAAVIFDLDDTLYTRSQPFLYACEKCYGEDYEKKLRERSDSVRCSQSQEQREFACAFPEEGRLGEALFAAFVRHGHTVFEASMKGTITLAQMHSYRVRKAMEDYGIRVEEKEALSFQQAYLEGQQHLTLDPYMKQLLEYCKVHGIRMAILTNGLSDHQRNKAHALGLEAWFAEKDLIASGDTSYNKPDPELFLYAQEKLGLDPAEIWYVGDSYLHDALGAHNAGWHTIWLDRDYASGSEERKKDNKADYTCHSCRETVGLLMQLLSHSSAVI